MDKFGFPTNIKQIGNIDENIRVYIEDNVYSYVIKLSEIKDSEYICALIGRCMIIDGKTVLFINGAIQGLYSEMEKGVLKFSKLTTEHIENERDKYFKGLEIVGWMLSQPNYGNFVSTGYINYHKQNFTKPYQVLFVTDPIERIHTFFNWDKAQSEVVESEGFFIYYDRNSDMKAYEEANKILKPEIEEPIELKLLDVDDDDADFDELTEAGLPSSTSKQNTIKLTESETKRVIQTLNNFNNEKNNKRPPSKVQEEQSQKNYKDKQQAKIMNMLVMVSSLLFFISIVLGTGMMKSDSKIAELEEQVVLISKAYDELVDEIIGDTTPVFNNTTDSTVSAQAAEVPTDVSINDIIDGNVSQEDQSTVEISTKQEATVKPVAETTELSTNPSATSTENKETVASSNKTYTVDIGDTLTSISMEFYGTKDAQLDIMKLNGIEDPNKIYYGMVLMLP